LSRDVIFYESHFPFYKDNIDTNLDTHDKFKHLLLSISNNDIVVPTSISDIVPSIFDNDIVVPICISDIIPLVSKTVLPSSFPTTDSSTPLYLIDIDVLQHQRYNPQPASV